MSAGVVAALTPEASAALMSLVDAIFWPTLGVGLCFGFVIGAWAGVCIWDWVEARADRIAYQRQFEETQPWQAS